MQIGFIDKGNWILPLEGTLGNKAKNLLDTTLIIKANGFKIPRFLVIPYEYLISVKSPTEFVLEKIDEYFQGWMMILVRSNAPDEDVGLRFPGMYTSVDLWHQDRGYAGVLLEKVIKSYDMEAPRLRRTQLGLPELGMCLLIMEPVTNTPGKFDASFAGCFSDIGELAVLTFNNPKQGLEAMISKPIKRIRVDKTGSPVDWFTPQEQDLAYKLRRLADDMPIGEGKGWSIEFVVNNDGTYIVQTTPIIKRGRIKIPSNIDTIFETTDVVGTGEFVTDGILYAPLRPDKEELIRFDRTHVNYCLVTVASNLSVYNSAHNPLRYLLNPAVILSLSYNYELLRSFPEHLRQYMREGRVAFFGTFKDPKFANINFEFNEWIRETAKSEYVRELAYSPTKLFVIGDEVSQKGIVGLTDKEIKDFVSVKKL